MTITASPPDHHRSMNATVRLRKDLPDLPVKILVAEDEHLVASGLQTTLKELGFSVVGPVSDGEQAIEACQSSPPDLVLMDIRMPTRNGLEAAEVIYGQMSIPVIILSAFAEGDYVSESRRLGVFGYLLKPVSQDQLQIGIEIAWGRFLESVEANNEISVLKRRLEERKIIEQAKWVIVSKRGISEPEAMKMLQKQARNNRRTLITVAQSILESEDLLAP